MVSAKLPKIVKFENEYSTSKENRKDADVKANEWLAENEGKINIVSITPVATQNRSGYYVIFIFIVYTEVTK